MLRNFVKRFFQKFDKDKDGFLDYGETCAFVFYILQHNRPID